MRIIRLLSAGAQDSINHYYEYKFANKCMFDEQVPACFRPCFYD